MIRLLRFAMVMLTATLGSAGVNLAAAGGNTARLPSGFQAIKHIVIVMQENRSFDSYFGTFPGAAGIPAGVCVPDPQTGGCQAPYHDSSLVNVGGPHSVGSSLSDINGGKMDGFVATAEKAGASKVDVMGYHDATELPTYWSYAQQFTLQDHMFAPQLSWSQPAHNYLVSGWSALCTDPNDPMSCTTYLSATNGGGVGDHDVGGSTQPTNAWTDITYLLHKAQVPWAYYVAPGTQPDCDDGAALTCCPATQLPGTLEVWNPLPDFVTVHQDGQLGNIKTTDSFYTAALNGTLPAVSWVVPNGATSEHPPGLIDVGQQYVSRLVDAIMRGPDWSSTAIFIAWDDWGGFYDHLQPPSVDVAGYGLRVPGIVISPWVKRNTIDSQVLSFDAYLKLIEDLFLGGQRIDSTDGRVDSRPDVRETASILGDLANEFDFNQVPAPVVTGVSPSTGTPAGGTSVTVRGADFTGVTGVQFGGVPAASFSIDSNSQITAVSPPGNAEAGITLSTATTVSSSVPLSMFTYTTAPSVSVVSPNWGPPTGKSTVTLSGSGFTGATSVMFGSKQASAFTVNSDSAITVTSPATAGTVDVTVTAGGRTSAPSNADRFAYVSNSTPAVKHLPGVTSGSVNGCTLVSIVGTGFSQATAVHFGAGLASAFRVNTDTFMTAFAPPGTGTVDITVTTPLGTSPAAAADRYTYLVVPNITGVSPSSGPRAGGTQVVITGTDFTSATAVKFGDVTASFTINSPTQITATCPSGQPGTIDITVTDSAGTSQARPADLFTNT